MLYNPQGQAVEATAGNCLFFTPHDNGIHIFSSAERAERFHWPNRQDTLIAPFELVPYNTVDQKHDIFGTCPDIAMIFAMICGYHVQAVSTRGAKGFAYELTGPRRRDFRTQQSGLTHPSPGHLVHFDLKSKAMQILDSGNQSIRWPNLDNKQIIGWADISEAPIQEFVVRMLFAGIAAHPIRLTSVDNTYLLEEYEERQHR